jgi:predicted nucleotidyltransferase
VTRLPARNPAALNLCVTNAEFNAIKAWVESEPAIRRAWIFGSRYRGVRREPDVGEPDIDLAVEILAEKEGSEYLGFMRLASRAKHPPGVHLHYFLSSYADHAIATGDATLVIEVR